MGFKLIDELNGKKLFLQFGGQGAPWYKELAKYYADEKMKRFFDTVIAAVDKTVKKVEGSVALPDGLPLKKWLDDAESLADDDYLAIAAVSMPMIQITQFAHYQNLINNGFDSETLIGNAAGVTGHSQGLITASFAGLNLTGDDYYDALGLYVEYLFLMGVRAQEVYTGVFSTEELTARSAELGGKAPAPMVAVLGEEHSDIEKMVEEINPSLDEAKKIYPSLYNSPSNRILSSYRSSLVSFHEKFKDTIDEKGIKYVYLRTSCPFHCELMQPIKAKFAEDVKEIGYSFTGKDLKVPLYSFSDGRNMQQDEELGVTMCQELMINTLYWNQAVKPVAENDEIGTVLDFGPGKTSLRLSVDTLKGMGCEKPVLGAAVPKDLKVILAS